MLVGGFLSPPLTVTGGSDGTNDTRRNGMLDQIADMVQAQPIIKFVETIDDEWHRWVLSGARVGSVAPWALTFDTEIDGRDLVVESAVGLSEPESQELLLQIHQLVKFPEVPE